MALVAVFAILAAASNSLSSVANRFLAVRGGLHAVASSLLVQVASGTLAVGYLCVARLPLVTAALPQVLTVAVVSLVGFTLIMASFAREDASAVGPLLGVKVIFLAVLEWLLWGHGLGLGIWLGGLVSVAGMVCIAQHDRWSLHPRDLLRPGMLMMLAAALCFAICDLFVKQALQLWHGSGLSVSLYLIAFTGGMAVLTLLLVPRMRPTGWLAGDRSGWRTAAWALPVSAVTNFFTQFLLFTAFAAGNSVTLPNILYNTRSLFVVLLAAGLVLGGGSTIEHAGWRAYTYRTIGAVLTLASVVLALVIRG